jgi:exodeoxyribonuclease-3
MRIATWNVNGIRARFGEVTRFAAEMRPDVMCLQEIKATAAQVPEPLTGLPGYWSLWHGLPSGYSGVSLHVHRDLAAQRPTFATPPFDVEARIVEVALGAVRIASTYVPNGNKDYPFKLRFLNELIGYARAVRAAGHSLVLCGDLNVTHSDADVHPTQRRHEAVGQRAEERELLDSLLGTGLCDSSRVLDPDNDRLYTWWPPWRELRQKNRGWRLDYVLIASELRAGLRRADVYRETGSSDHAPLLVELDADAAPQPSA